MPKENIENSPLGKNTHYLDLYSPELLFPIARQDKRDEIDIINEIPFIGEDIWNAYELSWLNENGLPQVAIGEFRFIASSSHLIESKSLKLYLNSLNQTRFKHWDELRQTIQTDLSQALNSQVAVLIESVNVEKVQTNKVNVLYKDSLCIDQQNIQIEQYSYTPELLRLARPQPSNNPETLTTESLCSHLLKSNCLITNQPDWASLYINYKGKRICHKSLLKYIVSFRNHNEFHEQCVERIFCDLLKYCQPKELTVYARYTRRGGLDINPWRSNCVTSMANMRLARQ